MLAVALNNSGGEMRRRPLAGARIEHVAGLRLRHGDEIADALDLERGMHEQHERGLGEEPDRGQVVVELDLECLEQALVHRAAERGQHDGVAVGLGACRGLGCKIAGRAGAVLDIDLLAEDLPELLPDNAGDDVGRAARRKPAQQADRLVGIGGLRLRRKTSGAGQRSKCGGSTDDVATAASKAQ
jgi:hypothetical protein